MPRGSYLTHLFLALLVASLSCLSLPHLQSFVSIPRSIYIVHSCRTIFVDPHCTYSRVDQSRMNGYHQHQHLNGNGAGAGQPSTSTANDIIIPAGPTNQPRLHVRSLNHTDTVFQLSGVETGYANSLRRVMMADVPTIGGSASSARVSAALRCESSLPIFLCPWVWGRHTYLSITRIVIPY